MAANNSLKLTAAFEAMDDLSVSLMQYDQETLDLLHVREELCAPLGQHGEELRLFYRAKAKEAAYRLAAKQY